MEFKNKGGIERVPVDLIKVSGADIANYLKTQILGFEDIGVYYSPCPSVDPKLRYVIMQVGMHAKDVTVKEDSDSYASRVLASHGTGAKLNEAVIKALEPFMFDENIRNYAKMMSEEQLMRMARLGLTGEKMSEISRFSRMVYNPMKDQYGIYLRPELILKDMLKSVDTDSLDGALLIEEVCGTSSETLEYHAFMKHGSMGVNYGIDMAALFR